MDMGVQSDSSSDSSSSSSSSDSDSDDSGTEISDEEDNVNELKGKINGNGYHTKLHQNHNDLNDENVLRGVLLALYD